MNQNRDPRPVPPVRPLSDLEEALPYDEEFLYHLSRGSEFLIANRVVEAKGELERALVFQPRDAKGQDLLAGVYFRLGVYPRAIELWSELVEIHPDDVALRVNLGLALLKTAQLDESVVHLSRATALDEQHGRAWGYLGLALWRLGRPDRARDAFVRGGQVSMARRMEEMLGIGSPTPTAPSLSVVPPPPEPEPTPARGSIPPVSWERKDAPPSTIDLSMLEGSGERLSVVPPARTAFDRWVPKPNEGEAFGATEGGGLYVAPVNGPVLAARAYLTAGRGAFVAGAEAMVRIDDGERAVLLPKDDQRLFALSLGEDETLYLVERHLAACEARVAREAHTIMLGPAPLAVVQLRGPGTVAFACSRKPIGLPTAGDAVRVMTQALVGWSGRLFPATNERGEGLVLRGEGTVLIA